MQIKHTSKLIWVNLKYCIFIFFILFILSSLVGYSKFSANYIGQQKHLKEFPPL